MEKKTNKNNHLALYSSAIQDHIIGYGYGNACVPKSLAVQRRKWTREAELKLPKIKTNQTAAGVVVGGGAWREMLTKDEVVDDKNVEKKVSLAQKIGLIQSAETNPKLSFNEWLAIKELSRLRHEEYKKESAVCAICCDKFGTSKQVGSDLSYKIEMF